MRSVIYHGNIRFMPMKLTPTSQIDSGFYLDTQLSDADIVERETVRQAHADQEARRERERCRRMFAFHWSGGML